MVSSLLIDALRDPSQSLQELYRPEIPVDEFPSLVSRHFAAVFSTASAFEEIPVLGVHSPPEAYPDRALVRFRGMIQDTSSSPEMYLAKLTDDRCGGWGLTDSGDPFVESTTDAINYAALRECTVLWAVTIPGETAWCSEELDGPTATYSDTQHQPSRSHKFPIPGADHIGVQVKVYNVDDSDALRITDLVTFVGILSTEPLHSELENQIQVPTLHVLFSRPHSPLLTRPYPIGGDVSTLREKLIMWIAEEALGGDRDAAEWILLVVIARVQSRHPPVLPPSLTLSCFPPPKDSSATPILPHLLSELLPVSLILPLSLDLLNKENFTPESKQEDLHSGFLQVPPGSTILITESAIQEGKLVEKGIINLRVVQDVLASQTLTYLFPFSQFSFSTDIAFIILSQGKKGALFQTSITIPLNVKVSEKLYQTKSEVKLPAELAAFRNLLVGSISGSVQVGDETSNHIQDDFVKERQHDRSVTPDDLIHRMTVARLMALSLHEKEVSVMIWERAKNLVMRRKARTTSVEATHVLPCS